VSSDDPPKALTAVDAPLRQKRSNYPEPFYSRMEGRQKHPLGDLFGLKNFGVNLTRLVPGGLSALHHSHSRQDEFIYIVEGRPTLHIGEEATQLEPGMCAGFPAGGAPHHLHNDTAADVIYLEIGDRSAGDLVTYPDDDIKAAMGPDGKWRFVHKDGSVF
jgi:uncharacterized cupin superfamily protein